jgi:hypothetical protein
MDGKRFDDISRLLSRTTGRRGVVKGIFGAILGGGAVVAGLEEASATKPLRGRPYRSTCTADRQCRTPLVCRREKWLPRLDRNRCGCPEGLVWCGGECVEIGTEEHCLACGDTCASNEVCCADGNGCTDLGTMDDCADCADACNPDLADHCADGGFCACGGDDEICDGEHDLCCDGACVDSHADNDNCGSCGNVCDVVCYGGECVGELNNLYGVLDADGNGYTVCDVYGGTVSALSCTTNEDCGGFDPACSGPNNRCICAVEGTYNDDNDNLDDFQNYGNTCQVITLLDEDGNCPPNG